MLALLWQETYIYNGEWNKLNTIMVCVSPWYCDTDNRVSCFVLVHHIQYQYESSVINQDIQSCRSTRPQSLTDNALYHSSCCIANVQNESVWIVISADHIVGVMQLTSSSVLMNEMTMLQQADHWDIPPVSKTKCMEMKSVTQHRTPANSSECCQSAAEIVITVCQRMS